MHDRNDQDLFKAVNYSPIRIVSVLNFLPFLVDHGRENVRQRRV